MVGNGSQHGEIEVVQVQRLPAHVCGGSDRGRIGGLRLKHPTRTNPRHDIRSALQFGSQILEQQINRSPLAHHTRQIVARNRRGGRKQHRFDPPHPFPPAQLRWQINQFTVQALYLALVACHGQTP